MGEMITNVSPSHSHKALALAPCLVNVDLCCISITDVAQILHTRTGESQFLEAFVLNHLLELFSVVEGKVMTRLLPDRKVREFNNIQNLLLC